jgi:hypothetical protein
MKRYGRCLLIGATLVLSVWLSADAGQAGGGKNEPFDPVVPKTIYNELVKREAEKIQELLNDKDVDNAKLRRANFGAVLIAALTKSVKDANAEELRGTFETAWLLHVALQKKDNLEEAKKLAAKLLTAKADPQKGLDMPPDYWKGALTKSELMDHFHTKPKGGDGMHPDLQNNIKFKGALNGIEEKIRYLSLKELSANGIKKEAKELELLGYRTSVVGALTYFAAPAKKVAEKDPEDWRRFSVATRDSGVALALAAAKVDAGGVLKASNALNSACSQCHSVFRAQ